VSYCVEQVCSLLSAGPGSVEEVFCQTFTAGVPGIGEVRMEPLIPGGEDIFVTEANRREYVDAYVDFYLNRSVQRQFEVLLHGVLQYARPYVCLSSQLRL